MKATNKTSIRERDLPAPVVVYYVIALALYMQSSCREVLRCLLEGVQGLLDPSTSVKVAGKSGISQARMRLGCDASVAAGPVGAGAKAQTADVLAFSRTKAGVYGGLNIEGSVVNPKDNWNGLYYGQPVTPSQILVSRTVANPKADPLRAAVAAVIKAR